METPSAASGGVPRVFSVIRALGAVQAEGGRVTQIARSVGLTQATTHRLLQSLMAEGMVEQDERSKLYRLSIDFFALAASACFTRSMRSDFGILRISRPKLTLSATVMCGKSA